MKNRYMTMDKNGTKVKFGKTISAAEQPWFHFIVDFKMRRAAINPHGYPLTCYAWQDLDRLNIGKRIRQEG